MHRLYSRIIKIGFLSIVLQLLVFTDAFALNCAYDYGTCKNSNNQKDCKTLGYKIMTAEEEEGYASFLVCPFDVNYKRGIDVKRNCSGYDLTTCPANATCEYCSDTDFQFSFKITGCNKGYKPSDDQKSCVAADCPEGMFTDRAEFDKHCSDMIGWGGAPSATLDYSGNKQCHKCSCVPDETKCIWKPSDFGDEGKYEVTERCCDGSYWNCERKCDEYPLEVKDDAVAVYESCNACMFETYRLIRCKDGYTLAGNTCIEIVRPDYTCLVGDIFYSDSTCSSTDDYDESKTPVGVVFKVDKGGKSGKIVNLHNVYGSTNNYTFDATKPYEGSHNQLIWGAENYIGETYKGSADRVYTNFTEPQSHVFNGEGSTKEWSSYLQDPCNETEGSKAYNEACICPIAKIARAFYPPQVTQGDSLLGATKWYLPAIGELSELYGIHIPTQNDDGTEEETESFALNSDDNIWTGATKNIINNTLSFLKGKGITATTLSDGDYWSSTGDKDKASQALTFNFQSGTINSKEKVDDYNVRLMLKFMVIEPAPVEPVTPVTE